MSSVRDGKRRWRAVLGGALVFAACSSGGAAQTVTTSTSTSTSTASTATTIATTTTAPVVDTVVAAGDIACAPGRATTRDQCQAAATATLAETLHPDVVLALGDVQYETGKARDFAASYDATWGPLKSITRPVPGNHEYGSPKAHGYYEYFGDAAHPPDGWYSFDLPSGWHVVVLNSECAAVGGCGHGSRQYEWLKSDLEATTSHCILAAWHHPRFSSGVHHSDRTYEPFWNLLADHGADLVLSGHDHDYERFAPDPHGIVQFVVGTGGRSHYPSIQKEEGSVTFLSDFGVLELRLRRGGYAATFHGTAGSTATDEASADC